MQCRFSFQLWASFPAFSLINLQGLINGSEVPCDVFVVDCGLPVAPRNGSLESYTNTTEGSEVFYSCVTGLVPEERMRAVCTRNGWSPNPADLSCSSSSTATPTCKVDE